jgi:predicted TPR repeat methyltransferase
MSNIALQQMYAEFSRNFDENLVKELEYKGPERVRELLAPLLGERKNLAVLDIGCGTGLAGVQFKPLAARLIGVDISPEMIDLARVRNVYDRLEVAEITDWLMRCSERYELILACDCLIYFGDLRQVILPVATLLCPKGIFAFTLEKSDVYPQRFNDTGRYSHHADHVREVAGEAGMNVARLDEGFLRNEYGSPVTGLFVALEKGGA